MDLSTLCIIPQDCLLEIVRKSDLASRYFLRLTCRYLRNEISPSGFRRAVMRAAISGGNLECVVYLKKIGLTLNSDDINTLNPSCIHLMKWFFEKVFPESDYTNHELGSFLCRVARHSTSVECLKYVFSLRIDAQKRAGRSLMSKYDVWYNFALITIYERGEDGLLEELGFSREHVRGFPYLVISIIWVGANRLFNDVCNIMVHKAFMRAKKGTGIPVLLKFGEKHGSEIFKRSIDKGYFELADRAFSFISPEDFSLADFLMQTGLKFSYNALLFSIRKNWLSGNEHHLVQGIRTSTSRKGAFARRFLIKAVESGVTLPLDLLSCDNWNQCSCLETLTSLVSLGVLPCLSGKVLLFYEQNRLPCKKDRLEKELDSLKELGYK